MEITPATPAVRTTKVRTAKTPVPKSSSKAAKPAAIAKPVKAESPAVAPRKRKTLTKKQAPLATNLDLTDMIATAAYYLAEQRQFVPGDELQDWLAAERLILGSTTTN